jgi:type II secretory pathway component GspD/PulD (secretin)
MVARSKVGAWRSNVPARARRGRGVATGVTRAKRAALALLAAAGMAWNAPALTAAPPGPGVAILLAAAQVPGQTQARPSRAHVALNTGIECNRRGEYEQAAVLFQQAQEGWADLSPTEQQELSRWIQSNATALQARREAGQQVAQAEQAVKAGRTTEANELLRKVLANQYLSAADKQKAQELAERARPRAGAAAPAGPVTPGGPANHAALSLARSKLQQARTFIAQGNFDAAEQLANEAQALNAVYLAGEDNPAKVLEDIFHARSDPRALLTAARAALKAGDLDRAEALAQMSAKADSSWNLHLWGDSPGAVLKDVQAARASRGTPAVRTPARPAGAEVAPWARQPQSEAEKPGFFGSMRGMFSTSNKSDPAPAPTPPPSAGPTPAKDQGPALAPSQGIVQTTYSAPAPGQDPGRPPAKDSAPAPKDPGPAGNATENARRLLQQARQALQDGNLELASRLTARARALSPSLNWWEDNPDKVQADIQRAQAKRPVAAAPKPPAEDKATADDPRALLRQGRQLFNGGDLDGAAKLARKAKAASPGSWGIFAADSPDKLLQEIDDARAQRDREESVKVLAHARKLCEQGDYDQASREAYRAQKLHGPYSWWDLGDRPVKLLAEIETARSKSRRPNGPGPDGTAVAKDQAPRTQPPSPPPGPRPEQAGRILAEARAALQKGDVVRAEALVQQVEPLNAALEHREERLQLVSLQRDLEAARQAGSPPANPPAAPAPAPSIAGNVPVPPGPGFAMGGGMPPPPVPGPAAMPNPADMGATPPAPASPAALDPARARAQQLLAESRQLQREGRLVEAREKALSAQAMHVVFSPTEDSPELALIQLSALGYKQIDGLMQQAADYQQAAAGNPGNYAQAEAGLLQARQLAAGFGFDTAPVEARLKGLAQQRATAQGTGLPPAAPPGEVRVAGGPGPETAGPGPALLNQARVDLRKGDTGGARKLAEEVYNGPYGMREQAEALLRSIDAEEFAQQRLAADRTYEAGMSAVRRHDYANASAILRSLNPKMLDDEKQNRLKNLFALPEMQPGHVAQASATDHGPAPGEGVAHVSDQAPAAAGSRAGSEQDLLKITQAMQDIKFQQLREEGLKVQSEAAARFRAGDSERAVEILQEYVQNLSTVQLDNDRLALLRRPIESRLLTFKTLKAQRAFENDQLGSKHQAAATRDKVATAQRNKQEKVAQLMDQYNAFYKDAKYKEAEMYAMAAFELDPDNAAAGAAVQIARIHRRQVEFQHIKDRKEDYFVEKLNDAEDPGPVVDEKVGVKFDADRTRAIMGLNRDKYSRGILTPTPTEKQKETESLLSKQVTVSFNDTPLDEVLEDLRTWHGVNIVPDVPALDSDGISLKQRVTIKLDNVSLRVALDLLLHQLHLTYVNHDGVLVITTKANASGQMVTATYQVADLIMPINDYTPPSSQTFQGAMDRAAHPQQALLGNVTPYVGPNTLAGGTPATSPGYSPGMGGGQGQGAATGGVSVVKSSTPTMEEQLIRLITSTIAPQSWDSMGGHGTINYFPLGMALVINQTPDIQEQVADLLAALRRLQDQEVAIEMRFISVAEAFFERIGVDFNINIKTDSNTKNFEPLLTSGQFKPAGFINDFSPDRFISGLTPAGTFTSDLDIPVNTSSFGMAIPPFGAFPNIPGGNGGIDLGIAFLSDIQVFLFMEAAQGDQRTNVLQAPKLTLSNGQTSSINVVDQQFFVTNVAIIQQGGQLAFVPQNNPFPTGVNMVLQAVISADRRFVRINFSGVTLTNLASAVVPLFPIVTPIIPLFEGGFQANPVLFTQFLQQPVLNQVTITTTVTVPDGGTVVLGGLKRLSEGRNEFGPPVLSKIPYVNRLFRNQGYGKEVESLLIMVTPRIIINEEEERIQTGVITTPPP